MHKTQRRVMLKFLKQHLGHWSTSSGSGSYCDLCYVEYSKTTNTPVTLARYIRKIDKGNPGPYAQASPVLCTTHAQELSLVW